MYGRAPTLHAASPTLLAYLLSSLLSISAESLSSTVPLLIAPRGLPSAAATNQFPIEVTVTIVAARIHNCISVD